MIFYYSATGNSRHVAMAVRKRFGGVLVDMTRALEKDELNYELESGEAAIFIFPVYFGGLPEIVRTFISRMNLQGQDAEIVGIATYGMLPGGVDRIFQSAIAAKGQKMRAFYDIKMVENYIFFFRPPIREAALMKLKRSDERIRDVLDSMAFRHRMTYKSGILSGIQSGVMQVAYSAVRSTRAFRVSEKCVGCGLCARICPAGAIELRDRKPTWIRKSCYKCTACINRCPSKAIDYRRGTRKKFRYCHPDQARADKADLADNQDRTE